MTATAESIMHDAARNRAYLMHPPVSKRAAYVYGTTPWSESDWHAYSKSYGYPANWINPAVEIDGDMLVIHTARGATHRHPWKQMASDVAAVARKNARHNINATLSAATTFAEIDALVDVVSADDITRAQKALSAAIADTARHDARKRLRGARGQRLVGEWMIEIALPGCVWDHPERAWRETATGELWHPTYTGDMDLSAAINTAERAHSAFTQRRLAARQAERLAKLPTVAPRIMVSIADSLSAGNCESMTLAYRDGLTKRLGFPGRVRALRADIMLRDRNDAYTLRAAMAAGIRQGVL